MTNDASVATSEGGDAATDSAADATVEVPKDAGTRFCEKTIGATIKAMETCCSSADKATEEYSSLSDAANAIHDACGPSLDESLAHGRVGYDTAGADTCFAAFDAALKNDVCHQDRLGALEILKGPSCRKAIVGKQGKGQACSVTYECLDGLTCVASGTSSDEGTCEDPPGVGSPCGAPNSGFLKLSFGSHRTCALGSHCDSQACVAPTTGECDFDVDCPDGKLCILDKCTPRGNVGDDCESPAQCNPGLFCDFVVGTSAGKCAVKKSAGADCAHGFSECQGVCADVDGGGGMCEAFCGSE